MLTKSKKLVGYSLNSLDGDIGKVKEFYFDDHHWTIRYLVANTGNWLTGRLVLISPYSLHPLVGDEQHISVDLTQKQIEDSPSTDSALPVSQQFELAFHGYYGFPEYWNGRYVWGPYPYLVMDRELWKVSNEARKKTWDSHLRNTHEVCGYHVHATDGEIGHVEDFIIDDETWVIRYIVIDTHNWLPGKKVLIQPKWIDHVSWGESKVFIHLTRENIEKSPEYSEDTLLNREYETKLHQHYDLRK